MRHHTDVGLNEVVCIIEHPWEYPPESLHSQIKQIKQAFKVQENLFNIHFFKSSKSCKVQVLGI